MGQFSGVEMDDSSRDLQLQGRSGITVETIRGIKGKLGKQMQALLRADKYPCRPQERNYRGRSGQTDPGFQGSLMVARGDGVLVAGVATTTIASVRSRVPGRVG